MLFPLGFLFYVRACFLLARTDSCFFFFFKAENLDTQVKSGIEPATCMSKATPCCLGVRTLSHAVKELKLAEMSPPVCT